MLECMCNLSVVYDTRHLIPPPCRPTQPTMLRVSVPHPCPYPRPRRRCRHQHHHTSRFHAPITSISRHTQTHTQARNELNTCPQYLPRHTLFGGLAIGFGFLTP